MYFLVHGKALAENIFCQFNGIGMQCAVSRVNNGSSRSEDAAATARYSRRPGVHFIFIRALN